MNYPSPRMPSHFSSTSAPWQPPGAPAPRRRLLWAPLPRGLKATVILWGLAGLWLACLPPAWIVGGAVTIFSWQRNLRGITMLTGDYGDNSPLTTFTQLGTGALVVIALLLLTLGTALLASFALLTYLVTQRGSRPARVVATALTGIGLLSLFGGPLAFLWLCLAVAGTVCAWVPSSTAYLLPPRPAVPHYQALTAFPPPGHFTPGQYSPPPGGFR